jgi:KDO2-lipid IV(A) lauroyltransferase
MPRPASRWKKLRWRFELAGLRAVAGVFAGLPLDRASDLGAALLRRAGPRLPVERLARENLRLVMPELDRTGQDRLLAGMWENLGRTAAEYPHLKDLVAEANRRIDYDLDPAFEAHRRAGGAMIVASAHFANWEVMHIAAGHAGLDVVTVVRQPNNPLVRDLLEGWRSVAGGERVAKGRQGAKATLDALKAGKTLAILADQKMSDGIEARFFGLPAMTPAAPAQLALRFGCPLFPARLERLEGARFRLSVGAPLAPPEGAGRNEAVLAMTQALNDRLEGWIRAKPEDWMWLHRRWPKRLYGDG